MGANEFHKNGFHINKYESTSYKTENMHTITKNHSFNKFDHFDFVWLCQEIGLSMKKTWSKLIEFLLGAHFAKKTLMSNMFKMLQM